MKPTKRPGIFNSVEQAFSTLELVVVIALLVILAGVLVPIAFQSKKEAQAAKILATVDAVTKACERFYIDNGRFPEDTTNNGASAVHELVQGSASLPNWKGPYLLSALGVQENPAGSAITLLNSLDAATLSPKFPGASGMGSALVYTSVDDEVAYLVDKAIDGIAAQGFNWATTGRVTYNPGSGGVVAAPSMQSTPSANGGMVNLGGGSSGGSSGDPRSSSEGSPSDGSGSSGSGSSGSGGSGGATVTLGGGSAVGQASISSLKLKGGANAKLNILLTNGPN